MPVSDPAKMRAVGLGGHAPLEAGHVDLEADGLPAGLHRCEDLVVVGAGVVPERERGDGTEAGHDLTSPCRRCTGRPGSTGCCPGCRPARGRSARCRHAFLHRVDHGVAVDRVRQGLAQRQVLGAAHDRVLHVEVDVVDGQERPLVGDPALLRGQGLGRRDLTGRHRGEVDVTGLEGQPLGRRLGELGHVDGVDERTVGRALVPPVRVLDQVDLPGCGPTSRGRRDRCRSASGRRS